MAERRAPKKEFDERSSADWLAFSEYVGRISGILAAGDPSQLRQAATEHLEDPALSQAAEMMITALEKSESGDHFSPYFDFPKCHAAVR